MQTQQQTMTHNAKIKNHENPHETNPSRRVLEGNGTRHHHARQPRGSFSKKDFERAQANLRYENSQSNRVATKRISKHRKVTLANFKSKKCNYKKQHVRELASKHANMTNLHTWQLDNLTTWQTCKHDKLALSQLQFYKLVSVTDRPYLLCVRQGLSERDVVSNLHILQQ